MAASWLLEAKFAIVVHHAAVNLAHRSIAPAHSAKITVHWLRTGEVDDIHPMVLNRRRGCLPKA
jgi:hypothetical protein